MTKVTSFVLGYQTLGGHTPTTPCYGNYFMIMHIILYLGSNSEVTF